MQSFPFFPKEKARVCFNFLKAKPTKESNRTVQRSILEKATWSGQYLHFASSTPTACKRASVMTLYLRATGIGSLDAFQGDECILSTPLVRNGYLVKLIEVHCRQNLTVTQSINQ